MTDVKSTDAGETLPTDPALAAGWLDTSTEPPTLKKYLHGWLSAQDLRNMADVMDGVKK